MQRSSALLVGLLAGIAGGLMTLAALRAGTLALVMLMAAPIAVYLAALGWGTAAGFVAAIAASIVTGLTGNASGALVTALLLFLPAAWIGHLVNLAQPDEKGGLIWYPLERILGWLLGLIVAGIIVTGIVMGYSSQMLEDALVEMLRELVASNEAENVDDQTLRQNARIYAALLPVAIPAIWLFMHVAVLYIAGRIAERSGRLARPRDDLPAAANLPFQLAGLPIAGLVGMAVAPSPLFEIAGVLAGAGIAGFSLVGLAELHLSTRGRPGRGLLLAASYLLIVLFTLPIFIFFAMGVARTWRRRPVPPTPPSPPAGGQSGT